MPAKKKRTQKRAPRRTIEVLEEDEVPLNGHKQVVEAEHTIKYSAPVTVPASEEAVEEVEEIAFEEEEEVKAKRKKSAKDEREQLRKELEKYGAVTPNRLKLTIDKYRHSDVDASGILQERDFCTKYAVTKEYLLAEEYLAVAGRYGPGRYWFTLRLDNRITQQWERQIVGAPVQTQPLNPNDPNSPQVVVNVPDGYHQAAAADPLEQLAKSATAYLKLKKAFEPEGPSAAPPQAQMDPETAVWSVITKNPGVMEKVTNGIAGFMFGKKGEGVSWEEVAMETIKSGQAPDIIRETLWGLFNGWSTLFPKPAQAAGTPITAAQPQQPPMQPPMNGPGPQLQGPIPPRPPGAQVWNRSQPQPNQPPVAAPETPRPPQSPPIQQPIQQEPTPADNLILQLIQLCHQNASIEDAQMVIDRECARFPELDESVDGLLGMPVDRLLPVLASYYPEIKEIPHAKDWLQKLADSTYGESEAEA